MTDTVVILSGGLPPAAAVLDLIPPGAVILAADRGAEHALALGLSIDLLVGDLDSVEAGTLERLDRASTRIERHPSAKDATDLELALDAAAALGPRRILVVGGATGRLDHRLAELLLLGSETYAPFELDARLGRATVHAIRHERRLSGSARELVSLLPLHGPAEGVTTAGLLYPLRGERLAAGSTRGVSNVFVGDEAEVRVESGVLLALRPGGRASAAELSAGRRRLEAGTGSS